MTLGRTASAIAAATRMPLKDVLANCENSWKAELTEDPQSKELYPNQTPREVFGHFVEVKPDPLPDPYIVAVSPAMAAELSLDLGEAQGETFIRLFSGDTSAVADASVRPWATPYAVSVFGQPITAPDPFGRGNGYGDGRALSLFECLVSADESAGQSMTSRRWELQLKGAVR